eukprot:3840761-Karenia_brevis.AAC.1
MGLSGRVVVIDQEGHRPVGVSHLYTWMHNHGKLIQDLEGKSPMQATRQIKPKAYPIQGRAQPQA